MPIVEPSGAPGGGSQPITEHAGDPTGVLTPSQVGALVIDTTNGALFQAVGATSADWLAVGGIVPALQSGTSAGVGIHGVLPNNTLNLIAPGTGSVAISSEAGEAGNTNGIFWNVSSAGDGLEDLFIQLGSTGQFVVRINHDGSVLLPTLPTSDPMVSGQLYTVAGVVHQSP